MKVGDLVRVSTDGDYYDPEWAGALAIVMGPAQKDWDVSSAYVPLKRISDGKLGQITTRRIEVPDESR